MVEIGDKCFITKESPEIYNISHVIRIVRIIIPS